MKTASTTAQRILAGLVLSAGAAASFAASSGAVYAQPAPAPAPAPTPSTATTPDPFDQIDLAIEPINGVIILSAESGWVWRNPTSATTHIVLDRDVEVQIGGSKVKARRAQLWMRPLESGTYQVFAVFEDFANTSGSFTGKRVPLRAVVKLDESIKLRLGARIDHPPAREDMTEFMTRASELYQRRVLSPDTTPEPAPEPAPTPATTLRWAPKELPNTPAQQSTVARSLPIPTAARKQSRVEQALARARSTPSTAPTQAVASTDQPSVQITTQPPIQPTQQPIQQPTQPAQQPTQPSVQTQTDAAIPTPTPAIAERPEQAPIFKSTGIFSIAINGKVTVQGPQEAIEELEDIDGIDGITNQASRPATITAHGGVTMQYQDAASRQTMDLEAQRVVIFLRDGNTTTAAPTQLNASEIEGIYLEGGVFAGNADWSVRSPKIYIDLINDKMLMLDAVFWTTDQRTNMPLYLRAQSVRQTSLGEFETKKARISNSAFFEPDLSIGVSTLKVSIRDERPKQSGLLGLASNLSSGISAGLQGFAGDDNADGIADQSAEPGTDLVRRVFIDGKNITLRLGSLPIFWLPQIKGDTDSFPLKEIRVGDSNQTGISIRTRWDAYSLFGVDPIPNVKSSLQLDYYGERGIGFGLDSTWNTDQHRGNLRSYLVPDDNGTDIMSSGLKIDRSGKTRGMISIDDIWEFDNAWTLVSKATYISDEAYIPAFERQLGRTTPDFDSMLRLERTGERTQLAIELSANPNDFFASEHLLQSPGYAVDKLPDAKFVSTYLDPFENTLPGVFDYQYEASIGAMRLRFSEPTASEYGFLTPGLSNSAFGITPTQSLADSQRALGLDEDLVGRFDTRHELSARFDAGALRINPFLVGRLTAYDTTFDTFSPNQTDNARYWGAAGVTVATTLTRVNDQANNDFLDIHRIRHIVEPSVTLWQADSGYAVTDTPIFDDDVEGLLRGTMFRAAIDQTWQTKRGGPGRWRDADILKLNTEYVWSSDRAGTSVIPHYYAPRPELSNPGTYVGSEFIFSPTDVLAFSGSLIFDTDLDKASRTSTGVLVTHQGFSSSLEYRDIRAVDASFLFGRMTYILTDKYSITTSADYNFDQNDFQTFFARVDRRFQIGTLGLSVYYDNINAETSIGFVFQPFGTSGTSVGSRGDFLQ
tara:strand:- start:215008 stop:218487 length:3480 start_codon:yes stop_codon:yes gene_type:complete